MSSNNYLCSKHAITGHFLHTHTVSLSFNFMQERKYLFKKIKVQDLSSFVSEAKDDKCRASTDVNYTSSQITDL